MPEYIPPTVIATLELLSKHEALRAIDVARAFDITPPAALGRLRTLQRYGLASQSKDGSWRITPAGRAALARGASKPKSKSIDRRRQRAMKRIRENPLIVFQPAQDPFLKALNEAKSPTEAFTLLLGSDRKAERLMEEVETSRGSIIPPDPGAYDSAEELEMAMKQAVQEDISMLQGTLDALRDEGVLNAVDADHVLQATAGSPLGHLAREAVKAEGLPETPENLQAAYSKLMAVAIADAQVKAGIKTLDEAERELTELLGKPGDVEGPRRTD